MIQKVLHKSETRGHADHGWLNSYHSFSFGGFYKPERMNFGALRVLNDDTVAEARGFGTHPHDNMEIISIPLEGDLEHKDSMGNVTIIKEGDIQVMSAGTGIYHSEYNKNPDKPVKFLQIWIFPNQKNVEPRYGQISLNASDRENKFQQILSPLENDEGVWIYQNAWFHIGKFDQGFEGSYKLKQPGNGVYAFVLSGSFHIEGTDLASRDGLGIWDSDVINLKSLESKSEVLLIEVPMQF